MKSATVLHSFASLVYFDTIAQSYPYCGHSNAVGMLKAIPGHADLK